MMFFEIFEDLKFLKIFDPQSKNFKISPLAVEISTDPKILGMMNLGPKDSSNLRARLFSSLYHDIMNFMSIFARNF